MIPAHDVARVIVGVLLAAFALALLIDRARDIRRWWRGGARQMERARRQAAIDQAARTPVTRDDVVISPEWERIARCGFCHDMKTIGDPEACACPAPCGRAWCTALRRQHAAERGLA